ncbi:PKD domain-containing protein [Methanospirillum sp.]
MKLCNRNGIVGIFIISLLVFGGLSSGEIPPISVQNAHTTINADFFVDIQQGSAPLMVTFSSISGGLIDHYEWSFGDGDVSQEGNPVHIYYEPGVYTVSLSVIGTGGSDKKTRIGYITVVESEAGTTSYEDLESPEHTNIEEPGAIQNGDLIVSDLANLTDNETELFHQTESTQTEIPSNESIIESSIETSSPVNSVHAEMSVVDSSGVAPLKVSFTDHSTGPVHTWLWDFGDGTSSAASSPVHIYQSPGTYDVSLTVQGDSGKDSIFKSSLIQVSAPVKAGFLGDPVSGVAPLEVSFSEELTGLVLSREWDFGDGHHSDVANPVHVYDKPGTYEVSLKIIGSHNEDILTRPSYITVKPDLPPPTPVPTPILTPSFTPVPEPDFSNIPDEYEEIPLVTTPEPTPEIPNSSDFLTNTSAPNILPPVADFIISTTTGPAPFPIVCTDRSSGDITEWIWDFGDGKILRGKNPTHTYSQSGIYSITLMVKGPNGKDEIKKPSVILVTSPQPTLQAEFTTNNTSGDVPHKVSFTDESSGIINGWSWQFGDGANSTEQNPTHIYTKPGTYDITLAVTGPDGTKQVKKEGLVVATYTPIPIRAAFSSLPISGEAPLTVAFSDKSVGDMSSWVWDFGDGSISEEQNPVHIYSKPGIYTVSLLVSGPGGSDVVKKVDMISVLGSDISPELVIKADPAEGTAPLTVIFNKSTIGNEVGFLWTFGDGSVSSETNPVHTYFNPGLYNVSLTIQDEAGNNRTLTKNEFVNVTRPIPPPIALYTSNLTEGNTSCPIRFTDMSKGDITSWLWQFGDGQSATTQDCVHSFTKPGNYTIQLTVYGPGGENTVVGEPLMIHSQGPLNVIPIPVEIMSPENLTESGKLTVAEEKNLNPAEWNNFTKNKTETIQHEIKENVSGPFVISEIIENETVLKRNVTESAEQELPDVITNESKNETNHTVEEPEKSDTKFYPNIITEIPRIVASTNTGTTPLTVQFSSSWATEPGSFLWNFGDGSTTNTSEPEHTYLEPGVYSIRLIREYNGGTQEIISNDLINVTDISSVPVASFSATPLSGPVPLNVTFKSNSSGIISEWMWDFGDSRKDFGEVVSHTYTRAGTYSVSLRVSGPGGSSEEVREDFITVGSLLTPPQAKFKTDKRTGFAPLLVNFTDQSLGKVTEWSWNFGDGSTSNEQNPSHEFNSTGIYSVTLKVTGPAGTNAMSKKGYLVVSPYPEPLIAKFNLTPSGGIVPLSIQCTDTSTGAINRYLWEFGDGAVSEDQHPTHRFTQPGSYIVSLTVYGSSGVSSADQVVHVGPVLKSSQIGSSSSNVSFNTNVSKSGAFESFEDGLSKPISDFVLNRKSGRLPLKVTFLDKSTGTIETWLWNFGDGEFSEDQNPIHMYSKAGTYTVSLTVKGPYGVSTKKYRDAVRVI